MEFLFEAIFQIVGELLLQFIFEILLELGYRSVADTLRRPHKPIFSFIGFALWGLAAGGISLLIAPSSMIADPLLQWVNLLATPMLAGAGMVLIGKLRTKRGQDLVLLDRFGYAFVFAFAMAVVRFAFAS